MKTVYYVGFYSSPEDNLRRKNVRQSIAGTVKMDFILKCLRKLDCKIVLVSIMPSQDSGFQRQETIVVNDRETHVYLPALVLRVFGKNIVRGDLSLFFLKRFLRKNVAKDDVVISYHSLVFGQFFQALRKKLGFRWVSQVEELYRLSAEAHKNKELLWKEEKMIAGADGYLFVNDILPEKYAKQAPYAVSYGNYTVFLEERAKETNAAKKHIVVYAGIITEDSGVYLLIQAMRNLPSQYQLRIIGMGPDRNIEEMHRQIAYVNEKTEQGKVQYLGTKTGEELTRFLAECDIGCSMLNTSDDFLVAFPSKILTYLGHGLKVVASRSACVTKSKLAPVLFFCDNNEEALAQTIVKAANSGFTGGSDCLRQMETSFCERLANVLDVPMKRVDGVM
ncbi:glycosyltransferase [Candidatus Allofournierella excrementigallinarum]|uniref:glycosyltransferase n=1 Tax=Candidatus Allofournierella excrementigallinarum TaxID=2838592 RepID=UPI00374E6105